MVLALAILLAQVGHPSGPIFSSPARYPHLACFDPITHTNDALRSQQFENAAWTQTTFGVGTVTVTANVGQAPDCTTTADRVQFSATPITDQAMLLQLGLAHTGTTSMGVWAKHYYDGGVADGGADDGGVQSDELPLEYFNGHCTRFALTSKWQHIKVENFNDTIGRMYIGNDSANCGAAFPSHDVLLWQADHQDQAALASDVVTTTTAVTATNQVCVAYSCQ